MGLDIRIEDRTGDTPASRKKRQRADPPHILLTTPESLALLMSCEDAPRMFAGLKRVVVDEIHALAESKRGDQLTLARLQTICPDMRRACQPGKKPRTATFAGTKFATSTQLSARIPDMLAQPDWPQLPGHTAGGWPCSVRRRACRNTAAC